MPHISLFGIVDTVAINFVECVAQTLREYTAGRGDLSGLKDEANELSRQLLELEIHTNEKTEVDSDPHYSWLQEMLLIP